MSSEAQSTDASIPLVIVGLIAGSMADSHRIADKLLDMWKEQTLNQRAELEIIRDRVMHAATWSPTYGHLCAALYPTAVEIAEYRASAQWVDDTKHRRGQ